MESTANQSLSNKKKRRGKECAAIGCENTFYDNEGVATGIHFFKFPTVSSEVNHWCNLIKRRNNKDGFHVSSNTVLCHHHFKDSDIKKNALRWQLLPNAIPSQKLPISIASQKKERKPPTKREFYVKKKVNSSIKKVPTTPNTNNKINPERLVDMGTQTDFSFCPVTHDHSYSTVQCDELSTIKNLQLKLKKQSEKIKSLTDDILQLREDIEEYKPKIFSLDNIKDDNVAVRFYTGFENYESLIAVYNYLEPKAKNMHFWQGGIFKK